MRSSLLAVLTASVFCAALAHAPVAFALATKSPAQAKPAAAADDGEKLDHPDNALCLGCHGNEGFSAPGPDGKERDLHVIGEKFEHSVHGKRQCVECHKDITEIPHKPGVQHKVSCVQCHDDLWKKAQKEGTTQQNARLGYVVDRINHYMGSIHARPNREDQSRTNATCYDCHQAHYVYPEGSKEREQWRLDLPNICGRCHAAELAQYKTSIHGKQVLEEKNPYAAVCSDCHSPHDIDSPQLASVRNLITKNCGNCHTDSYKTYRETYHGQVHVLGYSYTAKCYDCHGFHTIQPVDSPASSVYPANRLKTCQKCHANATPGYVSFQPHGNTHDFKNYPQMWIASKFMIGLLAGTFAFFWLHSALWFFREYRERKLGKTRTFVEAAELPQGPRTYYRRFQWPWRLAHLTFAVTLMLLTLTGMTALYADSAWAPVVAKAIGGPRAAAYIHRVCAVIFASIFFGHLFWMAQHLARNWRTFRLFGPNSLVPRWEDLTDMIAMFKWFFGRGPRPVFDRWTYWEKFDYWAPFWGVTIIGASGFMMWFPAITARFLPGWVFNVAMIAHGEEAFLAAVFLFTVHFFNNHFRPDKFPLDIVMFTGAVPLEEFAREHTVEYRRMLETGELDKHLVEAPSRPMTVGSKILGFTLIAMGLTLLTLVLVGFLG